MNEDWNKLLENEALRECAKEIIALQSINKETYITAFNEIVDSKVKQLLACAINKNKELQIAIIFLTFVILILLIVLLWLLLEAK